MSEKEIRAGIDAMWAAYNEKNADGFVGGAAEDLKVSFDGGPPRFHSRAEFRDYAKSMMSWSSDEKVDVVRTIISGNTAAVELHMTGTHDGVPLSGIPGRDISEPVEATGAKVDIKWVIVGDFEKGKLQNLQVFFNPMVWLEQIGGL